MVLQECQSLRTSLDLIINIIFEEAIKKDKSVLITVNGINKAWYMFQFVKTIIGKTISNNDVLQRFVEVLKSIKKNLKIASFKNFDCSKQYNLITNITNDTYDIDSLVDHSRKNSTKFLGVTTSSLQCYDNQYFSSVIEIKKENSKYIVSNGESFDFIIHGLVNQYKLINEEDDFLKDDFGFLDGYITFHINDDKVYMVISNKSDKDKIKFAFREVIGNE